MSHDSTKPGRRFVDDYTAASIVHWRHRSAPDGEVRCVPSVLSTGAVGTWLPAGHWHALSPGVFLQGAEGAEWTVEL